MIFNNGRFGEIVKVIVRSLYVDSPQIATAPPLPSMIIRTTTDVVRTTDDNDIRIITE